MLDGEFGDAVAGATVSDNGGIVLVAGTAGFEGGCYADGSWVWADCCWIMPRDTGALL